MKIRLYLIVLIYNIYINNLEYMSYSRKYIFYFNKFRENTYFSER